MFVLWLPPDQKFWSQKACAKVTPVGQQLERFNAQRCNYFLGPASNGKHLHCTFWRSRMSHILPSCTQCWGEMFSLQSGSISRCLASCGIWDPVKPVLCALFGVTFASQWYIPIPIFWYLLNQFVHLLYIMQNLACHKNLNSSEWFQMDRFGEKHPFQATVFDVSRWETFRRIHCIVINV